MDRNTEQNSGDLGSELSESDRAALQSEVAALRLRLTEVQSDHPRRVRQLEERLMEVKGQLAQETAKNEKLSYTLREARENIVNLRDEVDKLSQPPSAYGVVVGKTRIKRSMS